MIEKLEIPGGGWIAALRTERLAGLAAGEIAGLAGAVALAVSSAASAEAVAPALAGLPIIVEPPPFVGPFSTEPIRVRSHPVAVLASVRDYADEPADRLMSEIGNRFRRTLAVIGPGWARPFDVREIGEADLGDVGICVVAVGGRGHGVLEPALYLALAAGCAVIARYTPGLADLFCRTEGIDWFTAPGEAAALVDHYLHRSDLAEEMARRGTDWIQARTIDRWRDSILSQVPG